MKAMTSKSRRPTHPFELIHERKPLTPDLAIRLTGLIGGTADTWLRMQHAVDLWETEHGPKRQTIKKPHTSKQRKAV